MKNLTKLFLGTVSLTGMLGLAAPAMAQETAAAPPAAPAPAPVPMPAMSGPLTNNPAPFSLDAVPGIEDVLGKVYVSGIVTGMVMGQTNAHEFPGDRDGYVDLTNGMVVLQKTDGWFQWYVQAGAYSYPTLGVPYTNASTNTGASFGAVPQAWAKVALNDSFNVIAGELPTLIGDEYAFTYENMNVERGLLWAQEPLVSRGVQANYTSGPLTVSLSWNDGFYSNKFNTISGLISYGFNGGADTLAFAGEGNLGHTYYGNAGSTLFQNNGEIFNLIYTHTSGAWTISPYFQYTENFAFPGSGKTTTSSTSGAVLITYAFNDFWKLSGRFEYVDSSGPLNVLYGVGSNAFSFTITPTWQYKRFFIRPEVSYVSAGSTTPGAALGPLGNDTDQFRGLLEAGILL
uniref:BpiB01 n=1 Tax=uncultured bacterium Bio1 TaxID=460935 RepID=B2BK95_9BACT|nr:BpiB01 [uncultured bacterium Bio1]